MKIETIIITPKDNVIEKLKEAKQKSVTNDMPVLIELLDHGRKSNDEDKAYLYLQDEPYLVSKDSCTRIIGEIYDIVADNSVTSSNACTTKIYGIEADDSVDSLGNEDDDLFKRLRRLINRLHENSDGIKMTTGSMNDFEVADAVLFPAIDSKSSLAETIYLDRNGQLDDLSIEDIICRDQGLYRCMMVAPTAYEIERNRNARKQLDEYEHAKGGKRSLEKIKSIESRLVKNPVYKEKNFEKLAGKNRDLMARRINQKDRYVYGVLKDERIINVISVRGHYDL